MWKARSGNSLFTRRERDAIEEIWVALSSGEHGVLAGRSGSCAQGDATDDPWLEQSAFEGLDETEVGGLSSLHPMLPVSAPSQSRARGDCPMLRGTVLLGIGESQPVWRPRIRGALERSVRGFRAVARLALEIIDAWNDEAPRRSTCSALGGADRAAGHVTLAAIGLITGFVCAACAVGIRAYAIADAPALATVTIDEAVVTAEQRALVSLSGPGYEEARGASGARGGNQKQGNARDREQGLTVGRVIVGVPVFYGDN